MMRRTTELKDFELLTFLKAASIRGPSVQQGTSDVQLDLRGSGFIGAPSRRIPSVGSNLTSGRWAEMRSAVSTALDMLERMM